VHFYLGEVEEELRIPIVRVNKMSLYRPNEGQNLYEKETNCPS
jgi:hypothetical protein